jgi:NADH-quinone oxidoreductase subunit J
MAAATKINDGSVGEVGKALLTSYSMVFEVISVVLLVAIIGSLSWPAVAGQRPGS